MTFRVGQKVVCIDTWEPCPGFGFGDEVGPVEGNIYTVRDVGYLNPRFPDICTVLLHEIRNPVHSYREGVNEGSFATYRFRPIVERKTDISIFTKMLTGKRVDA